MLRSKEAYTNLIKQVKHITTADKRMQQVIRELEKFADYITEETPPEEVPPVPQSPPAEGEAPAPPEPDTYPLGDLIFMDPLRVYLSEKVPIPPGIKDISDAYLLVSLHTKGYLHHFSQYSTRVSSLVGKLHPQLRYIEESTTSLAEYLKTHETLPVPPEFEVLEYYECALRSLLNNVTVDTLTLAPSVQVI